MSRYEIAGTVKCLLAVQSWELLERFWEIGRLPIPKVSRESGTR